MPKIFEFWIHRLNERLFLSAAPSLDLLLARNGLTDIAIRLEIQKPFQLIFTTELSTFARRMLVNASPKVARDSDVQHRSSAVGQNVNVILALHYRRGYLGPESRRRSAGGPSPLPHARPCSG